MGLQIYLDKTNKIELENWTESDVEGVTAILKLLPYDPQFHEILSPSQQALASEVVTRWNLTGMWVLLGENRFSFYPFNNPQIRNFTSRIKPWFIWQQAFYELLAVVWSYPPSPTNHPLTLLAQYIQEERERDLYAIAEGIESRSLAQAKTHGRKGLRDWENWLEDKRNKEGEPQGNSTLDQVLYGARLLRKNQRNHNRRHHPLIREYIRAGREWWKFCERNGIVRPFAMDDHVVGYRKKRSSEELKRFPKDQGN